MLAHRIVLVVLLMVATWCMSYSFFFPLFRLTDEKDVGPQHRESVYYSATLLSWRTPAEEQHVLEARSSGRRCGLQRRFVVVGSEAAIAATVLGGLSSVWHAVLFSMPHREWMSNAGIAMTAGALLGAMVSLRLMMFMFSTELCGRGSHRDVSQEVPSLAQQGFRPAAGLYLLAAAVGCLLAALSLQTAWLLWCEEERMGDAEGCDDECGSLLSGKEEC